VQTVFCSRALTDCDFENASAKCGLSQLDSLSACPCVHRDAYRTAIAASGTFDERFKDRGILIPHTARDGIQVCIAQNAKLSVFGGVSALGVLNHL